MTLVETPVAPAEKPEVATNKKLHIEQSIPSPSPSGGWKEYEKIAFRFFAVYFLIQTIPLDWKFYRDLFTNDWPAFSFAEFFYFAHYTPRFLSDVPVFGDWAIAALIAIAGTVVWSLLDKKRTEYNAAYYLLRALIRYRLAIALLGYGFLKFFPQQLPLTSISNLNTNYGDFTTWKLFGLSLGIVPDYQSFLGLIEIVGALLLLNRKTVFVAVLIIFPFVGNIFFSNLAYEGGEYVYAALLISFALFIFFYDLQRLVSLTSLEKPTEPNRFVLSLNKPWQKYGRLAFKSVFVFFFVFCYGYQTYQSYQTGGYQFPTTQGLKDAAGIYHVSEFKLNNQVLPESAIDPVRWKDVVFEKWATLSVRSNQPVRVTASLTEEIFRYNEDRVYEFAGSSGRHYYTYELDSANQLLTLQNRNKSHADDKLQLHYSRPDSATLIVSGVTAKNDSIYAVLKKINKKYVLEEAAKSGRRKGLKL
jgi:hypothetical protein